MATSSPDVRLAMNFEPGSRPVKNLSVRLAASGHVNNQAYKNLSVRIAHVPETPGGNAIAGGWKEGHYTDERRQRKLSLRHSELEPPGILVSYFYLKNWRKQKPTAFYRDWVMDSGAFSAFNSGAIINLDDYIEAAKRELEEDPTLVEVYGLDVIGDWRASIKNTEKMWAAGIEAIPTFHHGSPPDVLKSLARDYPKIALGGMVPLRGGTKTRFIEECFARVWPCRIHGFGVGSEKHIMAFPFHSVDATSWEAGATRFGQWRSFGNLSWRGGDQDLRAEVDYYLRLERKARGRWRKDMELLASLPTTRNTTTRNTTAGRTRKK